MRVSSYMLSLALSAAVRLPTAVSIMCAIGTMILKLHISMSQAENRVVGDAGFKTSMWPFASVGQGDTMPLVLDPPVRY